MGWEKETIDNKEKRKSRRKIRSRLFELRGTR